MAYYAIAYYAIAYYCDRSKYFIVHLKLRHVHGYMSLTFAADKLDRNIMDLHNEHAYYDGYNGQANDRS